MNYSPVTYAAGEVGFDPTVPLVVIIQGLVIFLGILCALGLVVKMGFMALRWLSPEERRVRNWQAWAISSGNYDKGADGVFRLRDTVRGTSDEVPF